MRIPSTTFNWFDQSGNSTYTPVLEVRPLFLAASSFDKGPENLRTVYGDDFYKLFGTDISFAKHGQPAVQIANIIDAGGEVLIKRVVAEDATLANLIITATITQNRTPKVDSVSGKQIYIDADTGLETENVNSASGSPNEKAYVNTAMIKYDASNVTNAKTLNDVVKQAQTLIVEKDAGQVEGAGDSSRWVQIDATLEAGAEAPEKVVETTNSEVGEAEVGTAEIESHETLDNRYEAGTILEDNKLNVFKVTEDNKIVLLGNAAAVYTYPLFVVTDNGRGESSKRFNVTCYYDVSKNAKFAVYKLNYLGTANYDAEYSMFSCNPDIIYNGNSMSLTMAAKNMLQIQAAAMPEGSAKFITKLSELTGIEESELNGMDMMFGCNLRGDAIPEITVDPSGYILNAEYGMTLQGGSNGSFGDKPFGVTEWTEQMVKVFNGEFDDSIFDQDRYKIDVCLDANYPKEVKDAIATLVTFREDFFFFRDLGLNNNNYNAVVRFAADNCTIKNKFIADYCTTYDVIDKFTKKQINVTIMYSFARILVNHLNNTRNCPFSGTLYNVTVPEAIDGTINFVPKHTPFVNQKQLLLDEHINYATPINGVLTVETQITSQEVETQCSHINNILTVQNTMRDIRTLCPRIRGSFIDSSDGLEKYAQQVNNVIDRHRDEYSSISFTWTADDVEISNKIFNASLKVTFKNYVVAEIFNIYCED